MATYRFSYVMREGYVGVIRRVKTLFDPLPFLTPSQVRMTLFINGGAVNDNTNLPIGISNDLDSLFLVVDELQEFAVLVTTTAEPSTTTLLATVSGDYLLKTDVPANFQIASCLGQASGGNPPPSSLPAEVVRGKPPGYQAAPKYKTPQPMAPVVARATPSARVSVPLPPQPPRPMGTLRSGRNK